MVSVQLALSTKMCGQTILEQKAATAPGGTGEARAHGPAVARACCAEHGRQGCPRGPHARGVGGAGDTRASRSVRAALPLKIGRGFAPLSAAQGVWCASATARCSATTRRIAELTLRAHVGPSPGLKPTEGVNTRGRPEIAMKLRLAQRLATPRWRPVSASMALGAICTRCCQGCPFTRPLTVISPCGIVEPKFATTDSSWPW